MYRRPETSPRELELLEQIQQLRRGGYDLLHSVGEMSHRMLKLRRARDTWITIAIIFMMTTAIYTACFLWWLTT